MILGLLCAISNGVLFPIFALFLSQMMDAIFSPVVDIEKVNRFSLAFLIIAILELLINFGQFSFFNVMAENMTMRLRIQVFDKLIRMKVPFYEDPHNTGGALTSRLAEDCNKVNKLTASFVAMNLQNLSSLVSGIVISFVWAWQLSLVSLALMPFMILSGVIQMQFIAGFSDEISLAYRDSASLVMEVVGGIRTVKSFAQEDRVRELYEEKMREPLKLVTKKGMVSGIFFGLSQAIMFMVFGSIFLAGAAFIRDGVITPDIDEAGNITRTSAEKMFVALFGIMFAAMGAGNNAQFMPDVAEGNLSAARLLQIIDTEDEFQNNTEDYHMLTLAALDDNSIHSEPEAAQAPAERPEEVAI